MTANGEEVDADQAIQDSCTDLQNGYNYIANISRELLMCDVRNDAFDQAYPFYKMLEGLIKENIVLLKDFLKIMKQLLPSKPRGFDEEECLREFRKLNMYSDVKL